MLVSPTINHVHGRILSVLGSDPADNTEISHTVPDRRRWRLFSVWFILSTNANVITRQVILQITDGTDVLFQIAPTFSQIESLDRIYNWSNIGQLQPIAATVTNSPLPLIVLAPGYKITTQTVNRQATDNFSAPRFLVEEWIDP